MKKVLLVDDEYYFRQALKASFPWEANGFIVCGEARDGEEALGKIADLSPDIALVDINMPVMDGLAFAQIVRERNLPLKIIILSGHSEFDYARQAVQLGVSNYLLKPVDDEALLETLLELKQQMERENNLQIEMEQLKRQVRTNLPILRAKLIRELLQGQVTIQAEELRQRMSYLNIRLSGTRLQVAVIEADAEMTGDWSYEDRQLWNYAISNVVGEILGEDVPHEICFDDRDRVCVLASLEASGTEQDSSSLLASRLEQVRDCVQRWIRLFTVTIGIGDVKGSFTELPATYKEALIALKSRMYGGGNRVIPFGALGEANPNVNLLSSGMRANLLMHLRTLCREEAGELISEAFRKARRENVDNEILVVFCMELVSVSLEILTDMGLTIRDVFHGAATQLMEQAQTFRTLREMEEWAMQLIRMTMDAIEARKQKKAGNLVRDIKQLVALHYADEELGIDYLAKKMFVHYGHLCFVFKRETDTTINDYITGYRMEKAKELFLQGNRSVSDVANRVGYPDANYFGKLFKKHYGPAPSKFVDSLDRNA